MSLRTRINSLLAVLMLSIGLMTAFVAGPGCSALAPGGVYQGDRVLYDSDFAIATSYDLLHAFVTFELQHRAALSSTPAVKEYADQVRLHARQWITSAIALRDAYASSPTAANRDALQKALDVLREAILQATKYQATSALSQPPAQQSSP